MANDGQIVFEVTADGKHAIADIKDITKAIQQETGKWDDAAKKSSDNIGNSFSGMLKKLAAGFSAVKIGKALLDIGQDAIQAASDLQEVQNVVDTTFGANANQIETWAKNAGTQFGLTETMAKKFSSTMGAMLKSSGLAGEQIVDVSTDLAGLAADMASFYNLDFEEAFSKIRSGMSGMTMPLKELGIDMSVDTMNAFALAQGLNKTFSQMSQSEQTMLRYQYLMQATADAQGDFARTSDGYANGLRQLETNLTTLKTNLGNVLLTVVNPLINGINELFKDRSGEKTVLDDFAGIDAETEQKLERITQTAGTARELTEELDKIAGSKAEKAGSKLQQFADGLSGIDLDQSKAGIVKEFVSTLSSDIGTLTALTGKDAEGAKKWLEEIGTAAESLKPEDAEGWSKLISSIKEGLPGLENTDFGTSFFAALGAGFSDVEKQSSVLQWAVDSLGDKTNKTAEEQAVWLETCKRLVKTIPGLSSVINTETGEVKGGTQAIKDYIKAWEEGQTKLVLLGALEQKESALSSRFSDLPGLQLDMALAKRRAKKAMEELKAVYEKYGLQFAMSNGKVVRNFSDVYGLPNEVKDELNALADTADRTYKDAEDATAAYNRQKEALDEAKVALEEYRQTIAELPGDINGITDATNKFYQDNAENITTLVNAVHDATTALDEYATNNKKNVEASVNSTVKGFKKIETPMMEADKKTKDITEKLTKLGKRTKDNATEWDKLNKELNSYNSQKVTGQNIRENLKQQAQYMEDYMTNLRKAREKGVSNDVLAELSDGSAESYDTLKALAEASPNEVKQINQAYDEVASKKKQLTDELAQQNLTVDQTYQNLAAKAKEAIDALNLAVPAEENAGNTIAGMVSGISKHLPDVTQAVDDIIAQLDRLNGYGIHIDFGGFGEIDFTTSTGKTEGSARFGLSYAPHDDYIARLHEGERVLTAQENQIWNSLLNGGVSGFDLDSLGGVMRDNIKPGGNVYLDGKVVGSVISDRQGKSYKSLQRSGWQA